MVSSFAEFAKRRAEKGLDAEKDERRKAPAPPDKPGLKVSKERVCPVMVSCVAEHQRRQRIRLLAERARGQSRPALPAPPTNEKTIVVEHLGHAIASFLPYPSLGRLRVAGGQLWGGAATRELEKLENVPDCFHEEAAARDWGWGRTALEASRRRRREATESRATTSLEATRALCHACKVGDISRVFELLGRVDLEHTNWECSPLGWAAANGHDDIVVALYSWGASATRLQKDRSPIELAAARGHVRVVHLLFQLGDDALSVARALHVAAAQGHAGVVEYLAHVDGADLSTTLGSVLPAWGAWDGRSMLRNARVEGHRALEQCLLRLGECGYDVPDFGPPGDLEVIAKREEEERKPKVTIGF